MGEREQDVIWQQQFLGVDQTGISCHCDDAALLLAPHNPRIFCRHLVAAIIYLRVIASVITMAGEQAAIRGVLRRLAQRLSSVRADESCLTISPKFALHFLKVYEQGKSSFTGDRIMYIILVLPYLL